MKKFIPGSLVFLLAGCAALGLSTPQNLDQGLAYGYAGVTTALNTIAAATSTGQLTSAQATSANSMVLSVKATLDTAKSLETSNATTAQNDLTLAMTALTAVQTYLTANGVKQ
jgi:hypothetical protein